MHGGRVVRCRACDREVGGFESYMWLLGTNANSAWRAIPLGSVNEYQQKNSWEVNGHTTRCTSPVSVVLRLRLVSGWGLINGDQPHPMGSWGSGKDFTLLLLTSCIQTVMCSVTVGWVFSFVCFRKKRRSTCCLLMGWRFVTWRAASCHVESSLHCSASTTGSYVISSCAPVCHWC